MPPSIKDEISAINAAGEVAQAALKNRPSFSIRTRLSLGFLVWFFLSLGIAIISIITVSGIKDKLYFLEEVDRYTFEIQQARRYEKNYFLYHVNLDDALKHLLSAREIMEKDSARMADVIGKTSFNTMARHLNRYEELLLQLQKFEQEKKGGPYLKHPELEAELRVHGAEMIAVADELVKKERELINALLRRSQHIPLAFLVALLFMIVYLGLFIARQMLAPLGRIMKATSRIAEGNFTPITPKRKFNDEFSALAMAINHMMQQLVYRHNLLVQAHKLKAVGTLTAGIAHELNNPINNIMLTSAMFLEDYNELPEEERLEMLNDLMSQAERAQKIVRNLLDFARESEIESESTDVQDIIEETLHLATNQIKMAKVKIKGEIAPNLPSISGDRQQLTQVFLNMVLNALDAMTKGGTLTISIDNTIDRDFITVEFADTGTGIPEHILNNIFDPFFTTKPGAKGTGLGLSVSLGIIKQHGGDIQVRSQINKGTTFTISLPVLKVPAKISEKQIDGEELIM